MRRRSRAEEAELVREFESSGLLRQTFCPVCRLKGAAPDKYRRQATTTTQDREGRLVAVEVMPGNPASKGQRRK